MTEDMDLSYRAQLAGWHSLYLPDVDAPAELPAQMEAFKKQQARWAQGSVQCLRKLSWRILTSDLSLRQKVMALVHISGYFTQPLMVMLLLISLPLVLLPQISQPLGMVLGLLAVGPPLLFAVAQASLHRDWLRRFLYFPDPGDRWRRHHLEYNRRRLGRVDALGRHLPPDAEVPDRGATGRMGGQRLSSVARSAGVG